MDTEHLLLALLSADVLRTVLDQVKTSAGQLRAQIEAEAKRDEKPHQGALGVSPCVRDALFRAFGTSTDLGNSFVGPKHPVIGLAKKGGEGLAATMLRKSAARRRPCANRLPASWTRPVPRKAAPKRLSTHPSSINARDLTKLAREGTFDPVSGRAAERMTTIEILIKRKKPLILIGEPRVGKTAIVEGLAQRILEGSSPKTLRGKRLVELTNNAFVAGSKDRGAFEERVQKALKEISEHPGEMIAVIDERHSIVSAWKSSGAGRLDIANVVKPRLPRGALNLIGATTLAGFNNKSRETPHSSAASSRCFWPSRPWRKPS